VLRFFAPWYVEDALPDYASLRLRGEIAKIVPMIFVKTEL
jgi:hypothetical protein